MPEPTKKKVFVVDDHPLVRQGLSALIRQQPDLVFSGESADSTSALDAFTRDCPDIVIVDFALDRSDGIGFIKTLRRRYPGVAVLVLTIHDETFYAERALRAGALGYLTKSEASENVLTAIRSVLDGKPYVSDQISPKLVRKLSCGDLPGDDPLVGRLSAREQQVFLGIGHGKSVSQMAREFGLSVRTVEGYRERVKEKLCLKSSRELTSYTIRWILSVEPPAPQSDS